MTRRSSPIRHTTVEEGKQLRGDLPGAFTKNLLLRDKKNHLFFATAHEDSDIDLKTLHTRINARGRLSFAAGDTMERLLRVTTGTATPLALMHDTDHEIRLIVDRRLHGAEQRNFHPMVQTESIGLTSEQFAAFAGATGHAVVLPTRPSDPSSRTLPPPPPRRTGEP